MDTDWNIYLLGVLSRVTVSHNLGLGVVVVVEENRGQC